MPEKGVADAVEVLARVNAARPARLVVVGSGPEEAVAEPAPLPSGSPIDSNCSRGRPARSSPTSTARTHVVLVPSRPTTTWVEQFGRVIVEAQASGAVVAGYASGAIPEVAGEAAILTDVGAVAALGDRIAALASDPVDTPAVGRRASSSAARGPGSRSPLVRSISTAGSLPATHHRRAAASPRRRRELARGEFGPSAATTGGPRPFALPLLRRGGRAATVLATLLDRLAEFRA